jgi:hypothetical protein
MVKISFSYYDYLELDKMDSTIIDADFIGLLNSLAEFTLYIAKFKDGYR